MSKIALATAVSLGGLFVALSVRDPLAEATLTVAQRAAGFQSAEIAVSGEDCRFCRINAERILRAVPGVLAAKADMAHHRARVVYNPEMVQPSALESAVRGTPSDGER
jgi:hypothetical protein